MKFGEKLFETKLLSRLSHKVCRLLSSPVLLRKFIPILFTSFGLIVPEGGGGSYFPYISHLAKQSARVLPGDLCTDHAHYAKSIDQRSCEETKTWRSKAGLFLTIIFW